MSELKYTVNQKWIFPRSTKGSTKGQQMSETTYYLRSDIRKAVFIENLDKYLKL